MTAPLQGLVLAGGRSRRMGRDKALLDIAGRPALVRAVELLEAVCERVFVSRRPGPCDPLRDTFPAIVDRHGGVGPADGIASAGAAYPDSAWLVVACDLPGLSKSLLATLLAARDPTRPVTAFASAHDGLPEPLCTIYEPAGTKYVAQQLAADLRCPRKMLVELDLPLLPPVPGDPLFNVNTPEDWQNWNAGQSS